MTGQLIFRIAQTEKERHQARQVIRQVFVEELNYKKMTSDRFDESANYFIAIRNSEVIAALRIIPDGPLGLPIEEFIDITSLRTEEVKLAEVSRLACLASFRNFNVSSRGFVCFEETLMALGYTHIVIEALLDTVRLYRFLGFSTFCDPFYDYSVDLYDQRTPNSIGLVKSVKG